MASRSETLTLTEPGTLLGFLREEIADYFYKPGAAFQASKNHDRWILAMTIVVAVSIAIVYLHDSVIPYQQRLQSQIEQTVKLGGRPPTTEQLEQKAAADQNIGAKAIRLGFFAMASAVALFAFTTVFWLAFMAVGANFRYQSFLSIVTHAMLPPSVAWSLAATIVLLFANPANLDSLRIDNLVQTNPGVYLDADSVPIFVRSVLSSVDLYSIWTLTLLGLGVAARSRMALSKSLIVIAVVWLAYVVAKGMLATAFPMFA